MTKTRIERYHAGELHWSHLTKAERKEIIDREPGSKDTADANRRAQRPQDFERLEQLKRGEYTDAQLLEIMKRFLRYSLVDIQYIWDNLTETEKSFCSENEFKALVAFLKR